MGTLTCPICTLPLEQALSNRTREVIYTCPRCPKRPWTLTVNDRRFLRSIRVQADADEAPNGPVGEK